MWLQTPSVAKADLESAALVNAVLARLSRKATMDRSRVLASLPLSMVGIVGMMVASTCPPLVFTQ